MNTDAIKPRLKRATNVVTLLCNLKCKLCSISTPYLLKPYHPTLQHINMITDRLFELADYEIFEFTGGEPLLRNDFASILEHTRKYHDNVSVRFGFQTNGSVKISDDVIRAISQYSGKLKCIVDDYGSDLSVHALYNYEALKSIDADVELRANNIENCYCDGWVDFISNGEIHHSATKAKEIFSQCSQSQKMGFCSIIIGDMLYPCPIMYSLLSRFGIQPLDNEAVKLFDDTDIEHLREKVLSVYNLDCLSACRHCNGLCDDSVRYVPAEQFTSYELAELKK